jgi:hypothetical protein
MVREVVDIVMNIVWTGIFICLGVVSFVGLRNVVMLVRHKARRGWEKHTSRSRIVSRWFGVGYFLFGLSFIVLRASVPDEYDGWIAAAGYVLVLLHILVLHIVRDLEMLGTNSKALPPS